MLIGRSIPIGVLSIGKTTRSINHGCNNFSGFDLSKLMQVIKMISQVNHSWIIMFDCHIALFSCSLMSWHDTNGSGGSDGSISEVSDTQQ
jgi:hypothetical protein